MSVTDPTLDPSIKKHFFILGSPVGSSKSPAFHNTAFRMLGLPYHYRTVDCPQLTEKELKLIRADDFGGCSVTMPHKLAIGQHLDEITEVAKTLGAINTVVPKRDSNGKIHLVGDNTDYIGISDCLKSQLTPEHKYEPGRVSGLVVGAGGAGRAAIYALHTLGCSPIYLLNRTQSTAEAVAASFPPSYNIIVIPSSSSSSCFPLFIVGTIPASATATYKVPPKEGSSSLYVDKDLLKREAGGVLLDMAYLPRETPLLKLAWEEKEKGWKTRTGLDVLIGQGYAQFEMWTGITNPPRKEMADAVVAAYDAENPL